VTDGFLISFYSILYFKHNAMSSANEDNMVILRVIKCEEIKLNFKIILSIQLYNLNQVQLLQSKYMQQNVSSNSRSHNVKKETPLSVQTRNFINLLTRGLSWVLWWVRTAQSISSGNMHYRHCIILFTFSLLNDVLTFGFKNEILQAFFIYTIPALCFSIFIFGIIAIQISRRQRKLLSN
jgi:hypothetical protein